MVSIRLIRTVAVLLGAMLLSFAWARFEWRDVVQEVTLLADGGVVVRDERTLWTPDEDFAEAFICVGHSSNERVTFIDAGTVPPSSAALGFSRACVGGTELVVSHVARVKQSRVVFEYRIDDSLQLHSDVVQWYWNVLQREHPTVVGYRLEVRAPGPMAEPYEAFVMRYRNPETPRVSLSGDRSLLSVAFDRIGDGDGVEVRYLMDPRLFEVRGETSGLEVFLRDQLVVSGLEREALADVARRRHPAWMVLSLALVVFLAAGIWRSYRAVGREAPTDAMRYAFEPPSELPPAAVTAIRYQILSDNAMAPGWFATIMDLARRDVLGLEGEGRSFVITVPSEAPSEQLLPFEASLIAYLQAAVKGSKEPGRLRLAQLTRYSRARGREHFRSWGPSVRGWLVEVWGGPLLSPASVQATTLWVIVSVLSMVVSFIAFASYVDGPAAVAVGLAALASIIALAVSLLALPAWTPDVAQERAGWLAFRRTLSDYTRMKDAPPDFFHLWDRYYVYAAALGVAEQFLRNFERLATQLQLEEASLMRRAGWLSGVKARDLRSFSRSVSALSSALAKSGTSASRGGSSAGGGGGGGGGGRSGGR